MPFLRGYAIVLRNTSSNPAQKLRFLENEIIPTELTLSVIASPLSETDEIISSIGRLADYFDRLMPESFIYPHPQQKYCLSQFPINITWYKALGNSKLMGGGMKYTLLVSWLANFCDDYLLEPQASRTMH